MPPKGRGNPPERLEKIGPQKVEGDENPFSERKGRKVEVIVAAVVFVVIVCAVVVVLV